jgi:hypothetical protein
MKSEEINPTIFVEETEPEIIETEEVTETIEEVAAE